MREEREEGGGGVERRSTWCFTGGGGGLSAEARRALETPRISKPKSRNSTLSY